MQTKIVNNSTTVLYANGGGWLTQSYPTNFHVFVKEKVLTPDDTADNWREVTDNEKEALEKADAEWQEPDRLLIDEWNTKCYLCGVKFGEYNSNTGYGELNGITDISVQEMREILARSISTPLIEAYNAGKALSFSSNTSVKSGQTSLCRTYLPLWMPLIRYLDSTFYNNQKVEVISFMNNYLENGTSANITFTATFYNCSSLRTVGQIWQPTSIDENTFYGCKSLENITFRLGSSPMSNLDMKDCPKLSLDSVTSIVEGRTATTTPLTVKVHADVYAKLQSEWSEVLADAAAKNISFATN